MARVARTSERGVVYVEFLIAFIPLFLLFLALCQLALVGAAEAVVRHAAYAAVRTAIVVLDDDPKKFDRADRGSLSQGRASRMRGLEDVASKLGIERVSLPNATQHVDASVVDRFISQHGARMVPIQTAAYLPLLSIAPHERTVLEPSDSIEGALVASDNHQLGFAVQYTKVASIVTLHDDEDDVALAIDPIQRTAPVTARVSYLFHCTIPVVRAIMCRSLASISSGRFIAMALAYKTQSMVRADARFKVLSAAATLPNQGASYVAGSAE